MLKFYKWLRKFAEKKIKDDYMMGNGSGNCDSCCPRCKQWESLGNVILTTPLEDGSDKRECANCGFIWLALFTPAGFIPINLEEDLK